MIREAGFVEGVLVRKITDNNMKSFNVWRIKQVSDVSVTMLGEFDNAEKTLTVEFAKFQTSFMLTPELENEVLIMMMLMMMILMMTMMSMI